MVSSGLQNIFLHFSFQKFFVLFYFFKIFFQNNFFFFCSFVGHFVFPSIRFVVFLQRFSDLIGTFERFEFCY